MKEKLHIVLTEISGVSTLDVLRLLPELGLAGTMETVGELDSVAGAPDLLIADIDELEGALVYAETGVVMLVGSAEVCNRYREICVRNGVLYTDPDSFKAVFPAAAAMCMRMRTQRARESSLQRQLTDTKLVARAKLLLMTRLQMSEIEAHRFIEKTAMENREPRRSVALRLIRTYEE